MLITIVVALIILIALIVVKVNAFLAFLISSIAVGLMSGMEVQAIIGAIETGLGDTLGSLTIILGFGAVIGKLMAESGAAKQIANRIVRLFGTGYLNWAMAIIGFLVGIPMFFAIGFVILVPLMFSIAAKAKVPFIYLGIPLVASLSVTHGLLPPHPAPAAIAQQFGAEMGEVIVWGMVLAIPVIVVAGPFFASSLRRIKAEPLKIFIEKDSEETTLPGVGVSIFCALLPILLLMLDTVLGIFFHRDAAAYQLVIFLSQPLTSMLISTVTILYLLEIRRGEKLKNVMRQMEEAISGIAMILLIIGGAGALKQVLVEAGLNDYLGETLKGVQISPIVLCWGIAALIRIAVGSATVAAMTTAGILAPIFSAGGVNPVLLVLATGSGSIIFSHVNDGGFWLFKEYFNLSLKETLLSWSVMETIIAVGGLAGCLILNMII
jgi:Gnt-I system high-affinity gluconate transporter